MLSSRGVYALARPSETSEIGEYAIALWRSWQGQGRAENRITMGYFAARSRLYGGIVGWVGEPVDSIYRNKIQDISTFFTSGTDMINQ